MMHRIVPTLLATACMGLGSTGAADHLQIVNPTVRCASQLSDTIDEVVVETKEQHGRPSGAPVWRFSVA